MSSATVGLVRPPMGPGMGGGGMMGPGMMEPPVVTDNGMGPARKRKRKKMIADGMPVKPIGPTTKPKPQIGKPVAAKPVKSDPMKEIMGGVSPDKKEKI